MKKMYFEDACNDRIERLHQILLGKNLTNAATAQSRTVAATIAALKKTETKFRITNGHSWDYQFHAFDALRLREIVCKWALDRPDTFMGLQIHCSINYQWSYCGWINAPSMAALSGIPMDKWDAVFTRATNFIRAYGVKS